MTVCHLIGNGPSARLFDLRSGDRYGCNYPRLDISYKACGFVDQNFPYWLEITGHRGDWEWWTHKDLHDHVKSHSLMQDHTLKTEIEWMPNTGATMAKHLAANYDQVHLWGFDSMFSPSCASINDKVTSTMEGKRVQNCDHYWKLWFEQEVAPYGNFACHMPANVFTNVLVDGIEYIPTEKPEELLPLKNCLDHKVTNWHFLNYVNYTEHEFQGERYRAFYGDAPAVELVKEELKNAEAQEIRDT